MSRLATSILMAALALACGGGEDTASRSLPDFPPPVAPEPEPPSSSVPADGTAASPQVAPGISRGDSANGRVLYAQYCVTCHGVSGKGDGPAGQALQPRPADHSDPAYMGTLSDEHIFKVIQKGGVAVGKSPLMAAWGGVLSDSELRDLLAFVRELSGT